MLRSEIGREGLVIEGAPREPLVVSFDDQYIWSFTPGRDGELSGPTCRIGWPDGLRPFLTGTTRVRVATFSGDVVVHDGEVAFDDAPARVAVIDEQGFPLSVDKVGHLTRAFEATSTDIKEELLDATERVLRDVRELCGVEAYLCYGALLGAVRQGTMLGHDSDVDLCYYSHHTTPAEITLESFRIQRELNRHGWRAIRMSSGDIKLILVLSDGSEAQIDIFSAFTINGVFYQFGNRNGIFDVEAALLPLGTVTLEGREFPAPRDPGAMLAFIYGPTWQVPDPGFRYADNPAGTVRLDGWFRGTRTEVPEWLPIFTPPGVDRVPVGPSTFAEWVEPQLGAGAKVVDLGTGTGRDAFWFVAQGHPTMAFDYSRKALAHLRQIRATGVASPDPIEWLPLNDARMTLPLAAALSRDPHHLYARGLIGSLNEEARHQLFRMAGASLRGGQTLFLEFSVPVDDPKVPLPAPEGLTRRFDPEWLRGEIESHGGVVDFFEIGPGTDMFDQPDPAVARMRVVWPRP